MKQLSQHSGIDDEKLVCYQAWLADSAWENACVLVSRLLGLWDCLAASWCTGAGLSCKTGSLLSSTVSLPHHVPWRWLCVWTNSL